MHKAHNALCKKLIELQLLALYLAAMQTMQKEASLTFKLDTHNSGNDDSGGNTISYDNGGNIVSRTTPNGPIQYYYNDLSGYKDLLTSFSISGTTYNISYDGAGNPLNWKWPYTFEWTNGRQLKSIGGDYIKYEYDYAGIRTKKNVQNEETNYFYMGDRLLAQTVNGILTWFYYDETGICGMNYDGTDYYFEKNILGDVMAVWSTNGILQGTYSYDPWGFPGSMLDPNGNDINQYTPCVMTANPFRYRGYYFDKETYFYYVASRYYDPEIGRFISPDEPTTLFMNAMVVGGANLYAYCLNNPIMLTDSTGMSFWSDIGDFFVGVGNGFVNFWEGTWHAVTHPIETVGNFWNSITTDPLGTIYHMWDFVNPYEYYKAYQNGGWYGVGSHYGNGLGEVTLGVATYYATVAISKGIQALMPKKYIQLNSNVSYATAKKQFWKSKGSLTGNALLGKDGFSKVLHHPFGRAGANLYIVQVKTYTQHMAFHMTYGFYYQNGGWTKLY